MPCGDSAKAPAASQTQMPTTATMLTSTLRTVEIILSSLRGRQAKIASLRSVLPRSDDPHPMANLNSTVIRIAGLIMARSPVLGRHVKRLVDDPPRDNALG